MVQLWCGETLACLNEHTIGYKDLIQKGIITYDWRGYTTKRGKYSGKSHGNAWRIKPKHKVELFGTVEKISF